MSVRTTACALQLSLPRQWSVLLCVSVATSTGRVDGLHNKYQGACYYHNMKLTVRVCCDHGTVSQFVATIGFALKSVFS